jgi:DNA invertase Pin-like site-specific DNA recombinase
MALRVTAAAAAPLTRQRGLGIVRVSRTGKRKGEQFLSPDLQKERITQFAAAESIEMIGWYEELDVSGRKPLEKRHKLRGALERVERGEAEVIVTAYLDRAARSMVVMGEVSQRLDRVSGTLFAADFGKVNGGTAIHQLQTKLLMAMAEFFPAQTGEKAREARTDALDRGIVVFPYIPLGYRKVDRHLVVDEQAAPLVVECFKMRSRGVALQRIREFLLEHGYRRTYRQVQLMFTLELYLGRIRDGDLVSDDTHTALVDEPLFRAANQVTVPRGRKPREERLLSKLGLAVCASCEGALYVGYKIVAGKPWANYRCAAHNDCPAPVAISATHLEAVVNERMREELGRIREDIVSLADRVIAAEQRYERAQRELDTTVADLRSIRSANKGQLLAELQAEVDAAADALQKLRAAEGPLTLLVHRKQWPQDFTPDEQHALLRVAVACVRVSPVIVDGQRLATRDRVEAEFLQ